MDKIIVDYHRHSLQSKRDRLRTKYEGVNQTPTPPLSVLQKALAQNQTAGILDELYRALVNTIWRSARVPDEYLVHLVHEDNILAPINMQFANCDFVNHADLKLFEQIMRIAMTVNARFISCQKCHLMLPVLRLSSTDHHSRLTLKWYAGCVKCNIVKQLRLPKHSKF